MNTEHINAAYAGFSDWPLEQRLETLIDSNARAVEAVRAALPDLTRAAEGLRERLLAGGRMVYAGAGTSGRLAQQDAAELPPTFGFDRTLVLLAGGAEAAKSAQEGAEDDATAALRQIEAANLTPDDSLIAMAASGTTPFTIAAVRAAKERGAFTIGVANNPDSPLLQAADVAICLNTGAEVIAGSTRLAAGTAQKIVLNALSTVAMPELGAVYNNLMVNMRPVNSKLRGRAVTIVAAATGHAETEAAQALAAADWNLQTAIVMLEQRQSAEESRRLLQQYGHALAVRTALGKD